MNEARPTVETVTTREGTDRDMATITALATTIFRQHYPGIISNAQIKYMLSHNYSADSLRRQRKEGHVFLLVMINDKPSAFTSFSLSQEDEREVQIHKLYVLPELHGRRIGLRLIEEVERRALRLDRQLLVLTVNRLNIQAINFYFREGFTIRSVVNTKIGRGFEMADFVMEKPIGDQGTKRTTRH